MPMRTSAPASVSFLPEASERASPVTWWPAAKSSFTIANPINPVAPVTKTRIVAVSLQTSLGDVGDRIYAMEDAFISRSSRTAEDPLSDVLALLKPRGYQSGGIDAGGDWCFRFARSNGFFCLALVSGSCWLTIEGVAEPVLVQAG